jgi:hypothetical protein
MAAFFLNIGFVFSRPSPTDANSPALKETVPRQWFTHRRAV